MAHVQTVLGPIDPADLGFTLPHEHTQIALWHVRGRPGRAWAAIRQSEPAALAAGVNITLYKLWAFALASFLTGVAGGLLAAQVGKLYTYQFSTQDSILLLAVVLMGGIYSLWGAVVAGLFMKFLPALLESRYQSRSGNSFTVWISVGGAWASAGAAPVHVH